MAKTPTPKLAIPSSKVDITLEAGATAAAMKSADATAGKLYNVPRSAIKQIPGFNVRVSTPDYLAHRDMIAASIRENGYDETKPLSGYVAKEGDANVIYLTDGHTRFDAVETLGEDAPAKLPIIIRATAPSISELTAALHTNNTGRPLSPFELGVVVKRLLKDDGADKASIAKRLAVTPRYLDDVLLLVNSPKVVREAVLQGEVSSTMAIQQLRKAGDNPALAASAIEQAVDKAKAAGKSKATAKDTGPKMQKIRKAVSVASGTDMKDLVKAVAAIVRAAINSVQHPTDTEAKIADVDGTINLVIEVPAPVADLPAPAAKPAAKKPAAKKVVAKAVPAAEDAPAEEAKPKRRKKVAPAVVTPETDDNISADGDEEGDDLGIPGAEEVTSEGEDDEPAMVPPAVKNGDGVASDVSDI